MGDQSRRRISRCSFVALLPMIFWGQPALAGDQTALIGNPSAIAAEPAAANLVGPRSQQTVIVSARYDADAIRDLTGVAEFASENPDVAMVSQAGVIVPKSNGTTNVVAKVAGKEARVAVTVTDMDKPAPVQFVNHVTAVLSKAGCSMGACHGS